jgi:hypothetical protein
MIRPFIASILVALSLALGIHSSVAAAPPLFMQCITPANTLPIDIQISTVPGATIRAAVQHCFSFWGGHPSGAER